MAGRTVDSRAAADATQRHNAEQRKLRRIRRGADEGHVALQSMGAPWHKEDWQKHHQSLRHTDSPNKHASIRPGPEGMESANLVRGHGRWHCCTQANQRAMIASTTDP